MIASPATRPARSRCCTTTRPGHPHLFTGDSLFPGGVGNTFGDKAAFAQLIDEVETKVFDRLPDETWFYPGHGDDSDARRRAAPPRRSGASGAGRRHAKGGVAGWCRTKALGGYPGGYHGAQLPVTGFDLK